MEPVRLTEERKAAILRLLDEERESRKLAVIQGQEYKINWATLNQEKRRQNASMKASFEEIPSKPMRRHASECLWKCATASVSPATSPRSPSMSIPSTISSPMCLRQGSVPASRASSRTREMDIERIRREVEKEWTFSPNSHRSPRRSEGQLDPVDVISLDWQDKIDTLSTPKTQIYLHRAHLKALQEAESLQQCTFHPHISSPKASEGYINDRLFQDAVIRAKERQRLQALHEESKAAECTFKPRVHSSNRENAHIPIYMRLTEVVRKREAQLETLKRKIAEEEKELRTYRPIIGRKSELLAQKYYGTDGKCDVVNRMEGDYQLSEWRKTLQTQSRDREEMVKCPFSPQLSPVTLPLPHKQQISKKIAKLAAYSDDLAYSFHPLVDSKSESMVNRKHKSEDISENERLQRLARPDTYKHSQAAHSANVEFRARHPFEPKLVSNPQYRDSAPKYRATKRKNSEIGETAQPQSQLCQLRLSLRSQYARAKDSTALAGKSREEGYSKQFSEKRESYMHPSTAPSTPQHSPRLTPSHLSSSKLSLHLP